MLLLNRRFASRPELVELLVLAVLPEVFRLVLLLEDLREANGILLCIPLTVEVLLNDIFILEVMEVGVLSLKQFELVLNLPPGHQCSVARLLEYPLSPGILHLLQLHVRHFALFPTTSNGHLSQIVSINNN